MKKNLIQLIKIGQKQIGMQDDDYRAMLKRLTNKDSSTKCSVPDLHKVIHELKQKGADIHAGVSYKKQKTTVKPKSAITAKLYAVWHLMAKHGFLRDESENALNAYTRKMINTKNRRVLILNVGALDNYDASRLVEMLKKWHKRLMVAELEKQGNQVDKKAGYNSILEYYEETIFNA
ncbi:gp16 family protein [Pasteurella multocida]|uniref:gp16 family protein n=1 Tax=Pasteurella multocida TaxID=747 RepID=UPI000B6F87C3|nr:regulatory protein GemA [Pasteurella multocida]MBF6985959.1 regulatory protein GemA [Pasteurella multocida]MDA5607598.1 regulatory protein GemA [Pasteurella multocida subsp. multocida]MDA5615202.1 regulatory protein GemA [Pasteurella multocida]MDA5625121.1 regulatory protein GemA [Pasteurella multocida]OWZ82149.1 hypothetical protein CDE51_04600 [Pasteurella multocida]